MLAFMQCNATLSLSNFKKIEKMGKHIQGGEQVMQAFFLLLLLFYLQRVKQL